jgi:hypothetical protein
VQKWTGAGTTTLWHASFDGARWSAAEQILAGLDLHWGDVPGGVAVDDADRIHIALSASRHPTGGIGVVYLRRSGDAWQRHDVEALATYANLATTGKDSLVLAYVAAYRSDAGSAQGVFVVASTDAGRSWRQPMLVAGASSNSIFDLVIQRAGRRIHLVWFQGPYGRGTTQVLRHFLSRDGGTTWIPQADGELRAERHHMRFALAASTCGAVAAVVESIGGHPDTLRLFLDEVRWMNGVASTRPLFSEFALAGSAAVVAKDNEFRLAFDMVDGEPERPTRATLTSASSACGSRPRAQAASKQRQLQRRRQ